MAVSAIRPSSPAAAAGAKVRRAFKQPRRMLAVEEAVELSELPANKPWPEPTDHFCVVFVPHKAAGDWLKNAEAWMAPPPDQADAVQPVVLEREDASIQWRPGQALVRG